MLHRRLLVLRLRALVLAFYDNSCGNMSYANGGIGGIYALPSFATGAKNSYFQILRLYFMFAFMEYFRQKFYKGKRSMANFFCGKRRNAHKPVHSRLRLQKSIRIMPNNLNHNAFNASLLSPALIYYFCLKIFLIAIPQKHSKKHLCPVLRLYSSGAGVYRKNRVIFIVF